MVHNRGIMHAAHKVGGTPLCRKRNAHMSVAIEAFRSDPLPCKRCLSVVAKMGAAARRREGATVLGEDVRL